MNKHITHTSHFAPWDSGVFFSEIIGHQFGGLTYDLQTSDHCIYGLFISLESVIIHTFGEAEDILYRIEDILQTI